MDAVFGYTENVLKLIKMETINSVNLKTHGSVEIVKKRFPFFGLDDNKFKSQFQHKIRKKQIQN